MSELAVCLLPHIPSGYPNAQMTVLQVAGKSMREAASLKSPLPDGASMFISAANVHQAVTAARAACELSDLKRFAKDSRITVLRALASNPNLTSDVAVLLAEKAYKRKDNELIDLLLAKLPGKKLLGIRYDAAIGLLYGYRRLVVTVCDRHNLEELMALVADSHAPTAGFALSRIVSPAYGGMTFQAALSLVKAPVEEVLVEAASSALYVDAEFAKGLHDHRVAFAPAHAFYAQALTFAPAAPMALMFADGVRLLLAPSGIARLLRSNVAECDAEFVVSTAVRHVFSPTTSLPGTSCPEEALNAFATRLGKFCDSTLVDEVVDMVCEFAAAKQTFSRQIDSNIDDLLGFVSGSSRVKLLSACSTKRVARWLSCQDHSAQDVPEYLLARPGEIGAVIGAVVAAGNGGALTRCVATEFKRFANLTVWAEIVDALGAEFLSLAHQYEPLMEYSAARLDEVCGDVPEMWSLALSLWGSWSGSLTDLCDMCVALAPSGEPAGSDVADADASYGVLSLF